MKRTTLGVTFNNPMEIRMGSPYNLADLELKGKWVPDLPDEGWQDLMAKSPDGRFVALVAWALSRDNNPGFRIYAIDLGKRSSSVSNRIRGCCMKVKWNKQTKEFECNRFLYTKRSFRK